MLGITADHGMNAKSRADGTPNVVYLRPLLDDLARPRTRPRDPAHHRSLRRAPWRARLVRHDLSRSRRRRCRRSWPGCGPPQGVAERPGQRHAGARASSCRPDRVGDVIVVADRHVVLGKAPDEHDLSLLKEPLRSHGGVTEETVPFVLNRPLRPRYAAADRDAAELRHLRLRPERGRLRCAVIVVRPGAARRCRPWPRAGAPRRPARRPWAADPRGPAQRRGADHAGASGQRRRRAPAVDAGRRARRGARASSACRTTSSTCCSRARRRGRPAPSTGSSRAWAARATPTPRRTPPTTTWCCPPRICGPASSCWPTSPSTPASTRASSTPSARSSSRRCGSPRTTPTAFCCAGCTSWPTTRIPYGRAILGTPELIRALTRDRLLAYYRSTTCRATWCWSWWAP